MKDISTTDLKALYDFSVVHCELKTHTGSPNAAIIAARRRDILYKELVKRLEKETSEIINNEEK